MTSNQYFSAQLTSSMSTWFINQDVHFLLESCVDDYTVTGRVFRPYNNQQKAILNITLMIYNLTLFQPYLGGSTQYFCRYRPSIFESLILTQINLYYKNIITHILHIG